jgi:hypothetical protein
MFAAAQGRVGSQRLGNMEREQALGDMQRGEDWNHRQSRLRDAAKMRERSKVQQEYEARRQMAGGLLQTGVGVLGTAVAGPLGGLLAGSAGRVLNRRTPGVGRVNDEEDFQ